MCALFSKLEKKGREKKKRSAGDGREKDALDIGTVSQQRQFERATKKFFSHRRKFSHYGLGGKERWERERERGGGRALVKDAMQN